MTSAAVLREAGRRVIRAGCAVEIRQVAGDTCSPESGVHIVFMTLRAGWIDVSPGQREPCGGVVIERCTLPICRRMAQGAVLGETCRHVVRIGRSVKIRLMAGDACSRESGVHVVFVALSTGDTDMSACQRKRRVGVVKCCALPVGC